jgi:hypothetical protein
MVRNTTQDDFKSLSSWETRRPNKLQYYKGKNSWGQVVYEHLHT